MIKVISIKPEFERILLFLYPTYTFRDNIRAVSNFITHRDITHISERENLGVRYENAIFISTRIFDEVWDETKIKEEVLLFCRKKFKSRRRTLNIPSDDFFVDNLIDFIFKYDGDVEEDSSIMNLFNSFGSKLFTTEFLQMTYTTPLSVLIASMNTFITKTVQEDNTSMFYKKKSILYRDKIRKNLIKAYDNYKIRGKDITGLSYVRFCNDLIKQDK